MKKKTICLAIVTAALCNYALAAEFDSSTVYLGGDQVDYNSQTYEAQWWTQGGEPSGNDAWKLLSGNQDWVSSKAYSGGDEVNYNGATYKAKWWTKGDEPSADVTVWELVDGTPDSDPINPIESDPDPIPEGDYLSYIDGDDYKVGDQVALNGVLYECKVAGWCSQGGDAYNPEGWASSSAWTNLGVIDSQEVIIEDPIDDEEPIEQDPIIEDPIDQAPWSFGAINGCQIILQWVQLLRMNKMHSMPQDSMSVQWMQSLLIQGRVVLIPMLYKKMVPL